MENRISRLRAKFEELGIDAFLSTRLSNIRYLCGYSGSSGLLFVTRDRAYFLTDFRYQEQVKREVKGAQSIIIKKDFPTEFKDNEALHYKGEVGIEAQFMTVELIEQMKEALPGCGWKSTVNIVEEIASIKDEGEMENIRTAVKITDQVFAEILKMIKPGLKAMDLAAEITYLHMKYGSKGNSFDPIVASGYNAALPHAGASDKKIETGDFVTIDLGCIYQGYCSDMTRTVVVGTPTAKHKEIYDIVLKAQEAALKACHGNMSGTVLDKVARDIIKEAGYGEYYGHGLGHGLGLEVHAFPRATFVVDHWLQAGQVLTIEPGIYLPDWGGVRIEDDVIIKEYGCEVLNATGKELVVV
jgi:Xaa-Pro aminopeptidase